MYNPLTPNAYPEVKKQAYREKVERRAPPPPTNFLSAALLAAGGSASRPAVPPTTSGLPLLNVSAEELHAQRIQRSAALGVHRAVEYQKDAQETEFKRRKLEGSDTHSRVASRLMQMGMKKPPSSSSSGPTAPLVFVRSGLRTGGFRVAPEAGTAPAAVQLEGSPSAALLLRCAASPSLWEALEPSQREAMETARANRSAAEVSRLAEQMWAGLLRDVLRECAVFGVVSSCRVHVLSPQEEADVSLRLRAEASAVSTEAQRAAAVLSERVRVLLRFDSLAGAFKAAEGIRSRVPSWSVSFYPSAMYDEGKTGPVAGEPNCRLP